MFERLRNKFPRDISPSMTRRRPVLSPQAQQAEDYARQGELTGNRVYTLQLNQQKDSQTRAQRFLVMGCQGSGDKDQLEVARLMNDLCANPDTRPEFILVLGDNVYDWGADAADDIKIKECFDDIYLRPEFAHLHQIPFFFLLGNHDENLQNSIKAALKNEKGIARGMHEVAHSYIDDKKYDAATKQYIYSHRFLNLDDLPSYNMPRRYYSLITGDVQIFCADSNSYVKDYLDLIRHPDTMNATNNQAAWLAAEVEKAKQAGRKVILAQHHPLYTPGKRAYHNDLGIYLDAHDIAELQQKFNIPAAQDTPYNLFLTECLRRQELTFDTILVAHDHHLAYYNNKLDPETAYPICQITSAGGGGELQDRVKFSGQQEMGCFLKKTGVVMLDHSPENKHLDFTFYTADRQHRLEFTSSQPQAVIHFNEEHPDTQAIKKLFAVTEDAINTYLHFLGDKQDTQNGKFFQITNNLTHGDQGVERAHLLWAYIKQPYPAPLREIIHDIYKITEWTNPFLEPARHSLITILNQKMLKSYGKTMQDFATSYTPST